MRVSELLIAKEISLLLLLSLMSFIDIRERRIPNKLCILLAALALPSLPPELSENFLYSIIGSLAALPLFIAGVLMGGIGGGDIKMIAALGLVIGFRQAFAVELMGLVLALLWHGIQKALYKAGARGKAPCKSLPLAPFFTAGYIAVQYILGFS